MEEAKITSLRVYDRALDIDELIKEMEKMDENRTIWEKIEIWYYQVFGRGWDFFRYDLIQGIKNFWFFRKVVWRYRWYDYSFTDAVVEQAYKGMSENWHKNHYVGGDKDEKELKIIVALFDRMKDTSTLTAEGDEEDKIRKEIYRLIARKRYWD